MRATARRRRDIHSRTPYPQAKLMAKGRILSIRLFMPLFPTSPRSSEGHHTASESKRPAEKRRVSPAHFSAIHFAQQPSIHQAIEERTPLNVDVGLSSCDHDTYPVGLVFDAWCRARRSAQRSNVEGGAAKEIRVYPSWSCARGRTPAPANGTKRTSLG